MKAKKKEAQRRFQQKRKAYQQALEDKVAELTEYQMAAQVAAEEAKYQIAKLSHQIIRLRVNAAAMEEQAMHITELTSEIAGSRLEMQQIKRSQ